jgi:hypothetical protein
MGLDGFPTIGTIRSRVLGRAVSGKERHMSQHTTRTIRGLVAALSLTTAAGTAACGTDDGSGDNGVDDDSVVSTSDWESEFGCQGDSFVTDDAYQSRRPWDIKEPRIDSVNVCIVSKTDKSKNLVVMTFHNNEDRDSWFEDEKDWEPGYGTKWTVVVGDRFIAMTGVDL